MIALDTNILVRYLVSDDARQAEAARVLLAQFTPERPGFVCCEVSVELAWVLDRAYGFSRHQIAKVIFVQSGQIGRLREFMHYVSASEAKQRLAALLDAAQREPVTIRRRNRDVAVVVSSADNQRLTRSNVEEFQRFCDWISEAAKARGVTEETLEEVLGD